LLPNDWTVSISNEIYSAPDGTVYEGTGIKPDVSTVVFDPRDFYGGLNAAIEEATRLATCAS
jgi:carboxyl-terminal processing protease